MQCFRVRFSLPIVLMLLVPLCGGLAAREKVPPANYDEEKVPKYVLLDPLRMHDGRKVDSARLWREGRRPEILGLFKEQVYGRPVLNVSENGPLRMEVRFFDSAPVFEGKGIRHQLRLLFFAGEKPSETDPAVDFLIYTPVSPPASGGAAEERGKAFPMFLGLNFMGNHAIHPDPGIRLGTVWARSPKASPLSAPAREEDRGKQSRRWPIELLLQRGFAVGTAYYGDFEPDFDGGIRYGVRRLIYRENEGPKPDEAGAIGTWAWGLSMLLETVTQHRDRLKIDSSRVAVLGHSRLGKTSLWAGALDPRFALVVSNDSGCGGAALSRREFGETVHRINTSFPHWFCGNFKRYNLDVDACPVDQHELIALIAPRPVYIASASEDLWADPYGEFLAGLHADPVYRLLDTDGFGGVTSMPGGNEPVGGRIGYHLREGKHDIVEYDWIQFMNFADRHLR